ncbi:MAG: hypothetical protein LC734_09395 [Acidobacteria bacterium]|nr:hypothetical protein [Acidobacteriota bacterium]
MPQDNLANLNLDEKVGQLFFIGIPGPTLDDPTFQLLERVNPGGVCLFSRNIREARQTRELNDELHACLKTPPLISLDQEGGLVDRLRRVLTPMPAASKLRTATDARTLGQHIGEAIRILGFNMDFAPVVDVIDRDRSLASNGLHSRGFGSSAEVASELAAAFLQTLNAANIIGCLKHFPGLGASTIDSHEDLPSVQIDRSILDAIDLLPYQKLLRTHPQTPVMVAHAAYPKIDLQEKRPDGTLIPASLSFNFVTKLLRNELGFGGVAITDDLEMGAITRNVSIGRACIEAVKAGQDMLSICGSSDLILEGFGAVLKAVEDGVVDESRVDQSIQRIAQLKSGITTNNEFSFERLAEISREIAEFNSSLEK